MPPGIVMLRDIMSFLALVIALFLVVRLIQHWMLHRTLRRAIDSDPAAAVGLLDRLEQRPRTGGHDPKLGMVLVALGIALAGFGWMLDDNPTRLIYGASFFPILVGAALLLRVWLARRHPDAG